jgi:hypothetical protein
VDGGAGLVAEGFEALGCDRFETGSKVGEGEKEAGADVFGPSGSACGAGAEDCVAGLGSMSMPISAAYLRRRSASSRASAK